MGWKREAYLDPWMLEIEIDLSGQETPDEKAKNVGNALRQLADTIERSELNRDNLESDPYGRTCFPVFDPDQNEIGCAWLKWFRVDEY